MSFTAGACAAHGVAFHPYGIRRKNDYVTVLRIPSSALRATRFALSPLAETVATLYRRFARMGEGVATDSPAVFDDPLAVQLFRLLTTTRYFPDFIGIPPRGMETRIADELDIMRGVDDTTARATLRSAAAASWGMNDLDWIDGLSLSRRIADVLHRGWTELVEPSWTQRRAVLERDIRYRAGLVAVGGWQLAIDGMGRNVRWIPPDSIQFSLHQNPDLFATDDGLVFVPHTAQRGRWTCEAPPRLAMVYPARGAGDIPNEPIGTRSLIGETRSRILVTLESPTTPSELAASLDVSLGTVSGHLAKLSRAGTIHRTRVGHAVYYSRTPRGDRLVDTF